MGKVNENYTHRANASRHLLNTFTLALILFSHSIKYNRLPFFPLLVLVANFIMLIFDVKWSKVKHLSKAFNGPCSCFILITICVCVCLSMCHCLHSIYRLAPQLHHSQSEHIKLGNYGWWFFFHNYISSLNCALYVPLALAEFCPSKVFWNVSFAPIWTVKCFGFRCSYYAHTAIARLSLFAVWTPMSFIAIPLKRELVMWRKPKLTVNKPTPR